ncbi:MAG: DUF928 domain-containing protein [Cyanobacteria bacterium P01_H01_bin.26]
MNFVSNLSSLVSVYLLRQSSHLTGLGLAVLLCGLGLVPALAAEADQVRQGLPGRRISGASRLPTACAHSAEPLVAIVPQSNLGTTAVAEPTLWLSVPEVSREKQLEFYLFDAQDEIIYQTSFVIEPTARLVGLALGAMADAPELEIDRRYRWAASVICNPDNRSENISVEGWVDRIGGVPMEGNNGLWYDQLSQLLGELQRHPQDQIALDHWRNLMATARLDRLVPLSVDASSVKVKPTLITTGDSD